LLNLRDRLTRELIRQDFEAHPEQGRVAIAGDLYATPVADNRYTVIWRRFGQLANVEAVVASQFRDENPEALMERLRRVVDAESHGRLKLE
jgi:hypothetical protein